MKNPFNSEKFSPDQPLRSAVSKHAEAADRIAKALQAARERTAERQRIMEGMASPESDESTHSAKAAKAAELGCCPASPR